MHTDRPLDSDSGVGLSWIIGDQTWGRESHALDTFVPGMWIGSGPLQLLPELPQSVEPPVVPVLKGTDNILRLPSGATIEGSVHCNRQGPHIDVLLGADPDPWLPEPYGKGYLHVPYVGQTTIDMFTGRRTLHEQLHRVNQFELGVFAADLTY